MEKPLLKEGFGPMLSSTQNGLKTLQAFSRPVQKATHRLSQTSSLAPNVAHAYDGAYLRATSQIAHLE